MTNLDQVKVTPRDQQVLNLLVQGCTNKEIAGELKISPRTAKQHLRGLFCHARILDGRKRVKLVRYLCAGECAVMTPCDGLNPTEGRISILVWEGLTNRQIGKIVGISEQMIKNHLRRAFNKLGRRTNGGTPSLGGPGSRSACQVGCTKKSTLTRFSRCSRKSRTESSCQRSASRSPTPLRSGRADGGHIRGTGRRWRDWLAFQLMVSECNRDCYANDFPGDPTTASIRSPWIKKRAGPRSARTNPFSSRFLMPSRSPFSL